MYVIIFKNILLGGLFTITELSIYILEKVIKEYAPEISKVYNLREDESEEQQIKTGRLHECRILGILLKYFLEGKHKVTTRDVEFEYKKYFKNIARSTISTYLNMLKNEATLNKEKNGRIVYYGLLEKPPINLSPFWFTRIFCVDPAYFARAIYFASLYFVAERVVKEYSNNENHEQLIFNFRYIIGLLILMTLRNRAYKCALCQFSKQEKYKIILDALNTAIKERSDVLSQEFLEKLTFEFSEIPVFGGLNISEDDIELRMIRELLEFASKYNKDIEFQTMVLTRRLDLRNLENAVAEKENPPDLKEEKIYN